MRRNVLILFVVLSGLSVQSAGAAIVLLDLQGNAGVGLLPGNENGAVTNGGSGGEILGGITLDDVTGALTINVGWGSGNGFVDLSGDATAMHIHDAGSPDFSANGGILIGLNVLPGFNGSASSGGFSGTVNLTAPQMADLLAGHHYINVHTATNGGGEIRGNFVVVPEPSTCGLALFFAIPSLMMRRRRAR